MLVGRLHIICLTEAERILSLNEPAAAEWIYIGAGLGGELR